LPLALCPLQNVSLCSSHSLTDPRIDKLIDAFSDLTKQLQISGRRNPRQVSGSKATRAKIFRAEATVSAFEAVAEDQRIFDVDDVTQQALRDEEASGRVEYLFLKRADGKVVFKNEEKFAEYLTPKLELLFPGRFLVNSERVKWLRSRVSQSDRLADQKPDWFLVDHEAFFTNLDKEYTEHVCGGLSSWVLRDTVDLIEAKLSESEDGLTETIEYCFDLAQHCLEVNCAHCEKIISRAMLVYPKGFCLITTSDKRALTIEKCAWNTEGAHARVQHFFEVSDPWAKSMTEACKLFGCGSGAFVGSGGTGRVFRVVDAKGQAMALKLVASKFARQLDDEFATMCQLCKEADFQSIVVKPVNFAVLDSTFAAMLMPYGEKVLPADVSSPYTKNKVFAAMFKLHDLGGTHGDPRLDNIVRFGPNMRWIDFMGGKKMSSVPTAADDLRRMEDLTILVESITGFHVTQGQRLAMSNCSDDYRQLAGTVTVAPQ
jgi:hypothetical protein